MKFGGTVFPALALALVSADAFNLKKAASETGRFHATSLRAAALPRPETHITSEEKSAPGVVHFGASQSEADDVSWQKLGIAGTSAFVIGALAAAGAVYFALRKKEEQKEVEEEVQDGVEAAVPLVKEADATSAAGAAAEEGDEEEQKGGSEDDGIDYEEMVRLLSQRVAQLYGPKLAKAQAVKKICEDSATGFLGKARQLMVNELNSTAGAVMKETSSEEAMLMLDFDSAVGSYFPSPTVLLAGLMSPTVLLLSFYNHVIQVAVVHVPMMILCGWAAWEDWHHACGGIPTLHAWVYAQCIVAGLLALGHLAVAAQIKSGQATIKTKTEEIQAKLKEKSQQNADEMGLADVRELFICNSVLLQQALHAEETVRRSFCNVIIGALTVMSCMMTLWTLVLCLGWATVPGQVAMHPDAEKVVPANDFCGAWASIIAIRVVMMLSVLFLLFNLASIVHWVAENLIHSTRYTSGMVDKAKKMDDGHLGLPVAETLVKAFLLRGTTDMLSSQVSVAGDKVGLLEKEKAEQEAKLDALQKEIDERQAELVAIEGSEVAQRDEDVAKIQSVQNLQTLEAEAAAVEEHTQKKLEQMSAKFQDLLTQAKESEHVKAAMGRVQSVDVQAAVDQAKQKAADAADQVQGLDVQAALDQAKQSARAAADKVQAAAKK